MSSIRQGFQARILLFSSLARSLRYINLTDFELLPICYKSVFVVNIYNRVVLSETAWKLKFDSILF